MTRTVLDMEVEGVQPRGRPRLRYMDTIRRDMKKNWLTDVNILDCNDWRMAVSMAIHWRGRAFKFKVRRSSINRHKLLGCRHSSASLTVVHPAVSVDSLRCLFLLDAEHCDLHFTCCGSSDCVSFQWMHLVA